MQQTIDVTGLPDPVVHDLRKLVTTLRGNMERPDGAAKTGAMSAVERSAAWRAWAASHRPLSQPVDDSRESIYEGRGE